MIKMPCFNRGNILHPCRRSTKLFRLTNLLTHYFFISENGFIFQRGKIYIDSKKFIKGAVDCCPASEADKRFVKTGVTDKSQTTRFIF